MLTIPNLTVARVLQIRPWQLPLVIYAVFQKRKFYAAGMFFIVANCSRTYSTQPFTPPLDGKMSISLWTE